MTEEHDNPHKKGIYLLPNLFTTAGLFAGFYAIVAAMNGRFETAAIAIFVAMVMDTFDGRVARLTNTVSAFGAQYDSISDMVAFGIAPALVIYSWSLMFVGKVGWLAAFIFAAATALRLARFNSREENSDKKFFRGMPCPAAAGVIAGLVWIGQAGSVTIASDGGYLLMALLTTMIGLLMVSNFKYYSFKELDLKGKVPFVTVLLIMLAFVLIASDPPHVLFSVFFAYSLSGPIGMVIFWWRDR